jgi:hypothetical protein
MKDGYRSKITNITGANPSNIKYDGIRSQIAYVDISVTFR